MEHHGILSLAPAVLAIVLAVLTRNVLLSLFGAVALAGIVHTGSFVGGVVRAFSHTLVESIANADHAKTLLFTVFIGAMVGVVGKSGATRAVVEALARRARSARSVQVLSWLSGLLVFFDDYANCMIVGSAMGPLCDRYRVSRAKLAYIVDSTAAPVASLALVSTWVGFEVGVVKEGLDIAGSTAEPYAFFVEGWGYRFYPILAVLFVGMVCVTGRDLRPMRAHASDPPPGGAEPEAHSALPRGGPWLAILPIATLVGLTLVQLWRSGAAKAPEGAALFEVLAQADGYGAILQGAFASLALAVVLALGARALTLSQATEAAVDGMKLMFEALAVLLLAWSLSAAMKEIGAPQYLVGVLGPALPPVLLPTVVFLVGAGISFAVGSSYATMGVMMPMVIPLAFTMAPGDTMLPLAASGSVLAGACFGDHCSPISDTTVLSSIGSGADHLVHVRTQLPYALLIGGISVVFGTLPAGFGVSPWLLLVMAAIASYAVLRVFGKAPPPEA